MRRWLLVPSALVALVAACDGFDAQTPPPAGDAGTDAAIDAGPLPVDGGVDVVDGAPAIDAGPCANCRSGFCDIDGGGGCYPLAFVTSVSVNGKLEPFDAGAAKGAERGDVICNVLGNQPDKPHGDFVAWLPSDSATAIVRLTNHAGMKLDRPVVKSDGKPIVSGYDQLVAQEFRPPIDRTEVGGFLAATAQVWTGSDMFGARSPYNCNDWTNGTDGAFGAWGRLDQSATFNGGWTTGNPGFSTCNFEYPIYCFEIVK